MKLEQIYTIADKIKSVLPKQIDNQRESIGVVLGSGWGELVDHVPLLKSISYTELPHLPATGVIGHKGVFHMAQLENKIIYFFQGRFHPYEGHDSTLVSFTIHVLNRLGVKKVLLTNASGGVNFSYPAGSIVAINDHINLMGQNPLVGAHQQELGDRFPCMNTAYTKRLRRIYHECTQKFKVGSYEGIYAGMLGPCYETPAEIRMLRMMGADLVGMSTIPEVIIANAYKMEILALSCVSNLAAHLNQESLIHDEVKQQVEDSMKKYVKVLLDIMQKM